MEFADSLTTSIPITHHYGYVFKVVYCVRTELKRISLSWWAKAGTSLCGSP